VVLFLEVFDPIAPQPNYNDYHRRRLELVIVRGVTVFCLHRIVGLLIHAVWKQILPQLVLRGSFGRE
jgi:hypothetical protein